MTLWPALALVISGMAAGAGLMLAVLRWAAEPDHPPR